MTRVGFDSTYSILYYRTPPTDECAVRTIELPGFCPIEPLSDQPLHRRHIRTQDLKHDGDFLTGRRTVLMNADLRVGICKPCEPAGVHWFSNGEGDECWFANDGGGLLETVYGPFTSTQLKQFAEQGRITPKSLLRRGDHGSNHGPYRTQP